MTSHPDGAQHADLGSVVPSSPDAAHVCGCNVGRCRRSEPPLFERATPSAKATSVEGVTGLFTFFTCCMELCVVWC